jgi:hypothetical protein
LAGERIKLWTFNAAALGGTAELEKGEKLDSGDEISFVRLL